MSELADKLQRFSDHIQDCFEKPLATKTDEASVDRLKAQLSEAQSFAITAAVLYRDIKISLTAKEFGSLEKLKSDKGFDKLKVGEKNIYLQHEIGEIKQYAEFIKTLEEIIKNRCSTAQSLLKAATNSFMPNSQVSF